MGGVKAAAEPDPFAAVNHLAHQGCATYGPSRQGILRPSGVIKVDREIDPEFVNDAICWGIIGPGIEIQPERSRRQPTGGGGSWRVQESEIDQWTEAKCGRTG